MTDANWCYLMCDSVLLPLIAVATFVWTAYQEYRYRFISTIKISKR